MLDRSCGQSDFNFGYVFNDLEKVGKEEKIENLIMGLFIIMKQTKLMQEFPYSEFCLMFLFG